jgi:hypothetical protein
VNPPTESPFLPQRKTLLPVGCFRYSAIELLVALALLLITAPLAQDMRFGDLVEPALLALVMVSAVLAIGGRRRALIGSLLLVLPALAAMRGNHFWPDTGSAFVYLVRGPALLLFVVAQLIRFILRSPTVGYGDIAPVSKAARMLAPVESVAGLFYAAVLISRLVAIYSSPPPSQAPPAERQ